MAAFLAIGEVARAEPAPSAQPTRPARPTVVVWAEGADRDRVRAEVTAALGGAYDVVDAASWRGGVTRLGGARGSLEGSLRDHHKRPALLDRAQKAAQEAHVSDVVLVWTTRTRHGHESAEVLVVDAARPSSAPVHIGDPRKIGATARDEVTRAHPAASPVVVATAAPVSVPAPPPAAPTSPKLPPSSTEATDRHLTWNAGAPEQRDAIADAKPARAVHVSGSELLDVSASAGGGTRNFAYTGATSTTLRSYRMNGAPLYGLQGAIYPLADAHLPVLSDLGVVLGFSQAFALQSASADAGTQSTRWVRALAGGRFRLRTGHGHAPILGFTGAYESDSFTFSSSSAAGSGTLLSGAYPSVDYQALALAMDARVPLGRFAVLARGGYLDVLSAGDVANDFPHAHVAGVEAELGASVALVAGLEARVVADYHRYFYSLGTTPGDTVVASGAVDQMWNARASVAYLF